MRAASLTISTLSTMALIWSAGSSAFLVNPILTAVTTLGIYCKVEGKSLTKFFGTVVGKFRTPSDVGLPNLDEELGFEDIDIASVRKFNWWKAISVTAMTVGAIGLVLGSVGFISSILPSQLSSVSVEAATATEGLLRTSTLSAQTITSTSIEPLLFSGLIGVSSGIIIAGVVGRFQGKIKSTGHKKDLVEKIYEIIQPLITSKFTAAATIETIIGRTLGEIASVDGYKGYYWQAWKINKNFDRHFI